MGRGVQYHTEQTHYLRKTLDFDKIASGAVVNLGYLPAGAVVLGASAVVATAFNSATSDTLDIGTAGDGDAFATALDIAAVGLKAADELGASASLMATSETLLTATWNGTGAAPSAGKVVVVVEFAADNEYA